MNRSVAFALVLAGVGCSRPKVEPPRTPQTIAIENPAVADSGALPALTHDRHFEERIQELDALVGPASNFKEADKKAIAALPITAPFPVDKVQNIRAFAYDYYGALIGASNPLMPSPTLAGGSPYSAPSTLSAAQRERVLEVIRQSTARYRPHGAPERPVVMCDFNPHHQLVFEGANGTVLANIDVCFDCGEWAVRPRSPALGKRPNVVMDLKERTPLAELFDELRLGAFLFDEEEAKAYRTYVDRVFGRPGALTPRGQKILNEVDGVPSGIEGSRPAASLSSADIEKLWTPIENSVIHPLRDRSNSILRRMIHRDTNGGDGFGYECLDGTKWSFTNNAKRLPASCTMPTSRVEACMRTFRGTTDELCKGPPPACAGLEGCIPGVVMKPARAAQP